MKTQNKLNAGLYLVATPIGNLKDITFRAVETLKDVSAIACEDTRVTKKLLNHYGIEKPLFCYHEHNANSVRPKIISRIEKGEAIALVSDAGNPLISDPGYKLVRECREKNLYITVLPGASAVNSALLLSSMPSDKFMFAGFLPTKTKARCDFLIELKNIPATIILFESPKRLSSSLIDINKIMADREIAVAREITKIYEETKIGSAQDLINFYQQNGEPKGEIVIVISPPDKDQNQTSEQDINKLIEQSLSAKMSVKDTADAVSKACGINKKQAYQMALSALKTKK